MLAQPAVIGGPDEGGLVVVEVVVVVVVEEEEGFAVRHLLPREHMSSRTRVSACER
jgi:hypothetical protein